jgi:hypothetical protein
MKIVVYVAVAVALGLIVMIAPLMAFTVYGYHSVISQSEVGKKFISERVWNGTDAASFGGNNSNSVQTLTFSQAAQLYGWMDVRTEPFPTSLVPAILLVVTSFVAALGAVLFLRNKVQ